MLRGMFAFVIYDKNTGEIVGVRDHFGIKPFYYYYDKDDNEVVVQAGESVNVDNIRTTHNDDWYG